MHSMTRSLLALIVMAGGVWGQSVVAACPAAGAGPAADVAAHPDHDSGSAHHVQGAGASADDHPSEEHSSSSCMLLMGCGSTGLTARASLGAVALGPTVEPEAFAPPLDRTFVFLPHEPPPPRPSI